MKWTERKGVTLGLMSLLVVAAALCCVLENGVHAESRLLRAEVMRRVLSARNLVDLPKEENQIGKAETSSLPTEHTSASELSSNLIHSVSPVSSIEPSTSTADVALTHSEEQGEEKKDDAKASPTAENKDADTAENQQPTVGAEEALPAEFLPLPPEPQTPRRTAGALPLQLHAHRVPASPASASASASSQSSSSRSAPRAGSLRSSRSSSAATSRFRQPTVPKILRSAAQGSLPASPPDSWFQSAASSSRLSRTFPEEYFQRRKWIATIDTEEGEGSFFWPQVPDSTAKQSTNEEGEDEEETAESRLRPLSHRPLQGLEVFAGEKEIEVEVDSRLFPLTRLWTPSSPPTPPSPPIVAQSKSDDELHFRLSSSLSPQEEEAVFGNPLFEPRTDDLQNLAQSDYLRGFIVNELTPRSERKRGGLRVFSPESTASSSSFSTISSALTFSIPDAMEEEGKKEVESEEVRDQYEVPSVASPISETTEEISDSSEEFGEEFFLPLPPGKEKRDHLSSSSFPPSFPPIFQSSGEGQEKVQEEEEVQSKLVPHSPLFEEAKSEEEGSESQQESVNLSPLSTASASISSALPPTMPVDLETLAELWQNREDKLRDEAEGIPADEEARLVSFDPNVFSSFSSSSASISQLEEEAGQDREQILSIPLSDLSSASSLSHSEIEIEEENPFDESSSEVRESEVLSQDVKDQEEEAVTVQMQRSAEVDSQSIIDKEDEEGSVNTSPVPQTEKSVDAKDSAAEPAQRSDSLSAGSSSDPFRTFLDYDKLVEEIKEEGSAGAYEAESRLKEDQREREEDMDEGSSMSQTTESSTFSVGMEGLSISEDDEAEGEGEREDNVVREGTPALVTFEDLSALSSVPGSDPLFEEDHQEEIRSENIMGFSPLPVALEPETSVAESVEADESSLQASFLGISGGDYDSHSLRSSVHSSAAFSPVLGRDPGPQGEKTSRSYFSQSSPQENSEPSLEISSQLEDPFYFNSEVSIDSTDFSPVLGRDPGPSRKERSFREEIEVSLVDDSAFVYHRKEEEPEVSSEHVPLSIQAQTHEALDLQKDQPQYLPESSIDSTGFSQVLGRDHSSSRAQERFGEEDETSWAGDSKVVLPLQEEEPEIWSDQASISSQTFTEDASAQEEDQTRNFPESSIDSTDFSAVQGRGTESRRTAGSFGEEVETFLEDGSDTTVPSLQEVELEARDENVPGFSQAVSDDSLEEGEASSDDSTAVSTVLGDDLGISSHSFAKASSQPSQTAAESTQEERAREHASASFSVFRPELSRLRLPPKQDSQLKVNKDVPKKNTMDITPPLLVDLFAEEEAVNEQQGIKQVEGQQSPAQPTPDANDAGEQEDMNVHEEEVPTTNGEGEAERHEESSEIIAEKPEVQEEERHEVISEKADSTEKEQPEEEETHQPAGEGSLDNKAQKSILSQPEEASHSSNHGIANAVETLEEPLIASESSEEELIVPEQLAKSPIKEGDELEGVAKSSQNEVGGHEEVPSSSQGVAVDFETSVKIPTQMSTPAPEGNEPENSSIHLDEEEVTQQGEGQETRLQSEREQEGDADTDAMNLAEEIEAVEEEPLMREEEAMERAAEVEHEKEPHIESQDRGAESDADEFFSVQSFGSSRASSVANFHSLAFQQIAESPSEEQRAVTIEEENEDDADEFFDAEEDSLSTSSRASSVDSLEEHDEVVGGDILSLPTQEEGPAQDQDEQVASYTTPPSVDEAEGSSQQEGQSTDITRSASSSSLAGNDGQGIEGSSINSYPDTPLSGSGSSGNEGGGNDDDGGSTSSSVFSGEDTPPFYSPRSRYPNSDSSSSDLSLPVTDSDDDSGEGEGDRSGRLAELKEMLLEAQRENGFGSSRSASESGQTSQGSGMTLGLSRTPEEEAVEGVEDAETPGEAETLSGTEAQGSDETSDDSGAPSSENPGASTSSGVNSNRQEDEGNVAASASVREERPTAGVATPLPVVEGEEAHQERASEPAADSEISPELTVPGDEDAAGPSESSSTSISGSQVTVTAEVESIPASSSSTTVISPEQPESSIHFTTSEQAPTYSPILVTPSPRPEANSRGSSLSSSFSEPVGLAPLSASSTSAGKDPQFGPAAETFNVNPDPKKASPLLETLNVKRTGDFPQLSAQESVQQLQPRGENMEEEQGEVERAQGTEDASSSSLRREPKKEKDISELPEISTEKVTKEEKIATGPPLTPPLREAQRGQRGSYGAGAESDAKSPHSSCASSLVILLLSSLLLVSSSSVFIAL